MTIPRDIANSTKETLVYMGIDVLGGSRQTLAATEAVSRLAQNTISRVAAITGAAVPLVFPLTGLLSLATARWAIRDASTQLAQAKTDLETAPEGSVKKSSAKHAITTARLGIANQTLYGAMGAGQIAVGGVELASPTVAHTLHYAPTLQGAAASTAGLATGVALGAIYILRGIFMLAKGLMNKKVICDFEATWKTQTSKEDLLKKFEEGHLGKLVTVDSTLADSEKIKAIDKGIFTAKLYQNISIIIAGSMILGGVLAIALAIMACHMGVGAPAYLGIGLSSATFFIAMEFIFLMYDSSALFEKFRDSRYKLSEHIDKIINPPVADNTAPSS